MHKRTLKQNTIKIPENSSKLKNYKSSENNLSDLQLPSLDQKKKGRRNANSNKSILEHTNTMTFMPSSSEIENIATKKVMQQWEAIENTLYEDGNQVIHPHVLEECIQWRSQIPHLRIIGNNPLFAQKSKYENFNINYNKLQSNFNFENEKPSIEHKLQVKERKSLSKYTLQKTVQDEIFNILYEYVISELFPKKYNETNLLCNDFNDVLKVNITPIHNNKTFTKKANYKWFEETASLENRILNNECKPIEDHITLIQKETSLSNIREIQKKYGNSTHNNRIKSEVMNIMEDTLSRPHTSRNKLGTVFNEKIVVSPVPYVLSTRESFSTVKTTPIKFMAQPLSMSTSQGFNRNMYFKNSGKSSASKTMSNYQSAWHSPVSPAIWPKNMKLAPLDTSRLSSCKNRSTSSLVTSLYNRKPLSPISRSTVPSSVRAAHNNNGYLKIEGKHVIPGQSLKLGITGTIWDYTAESSKNKRKKSQLKAKS